MKMRWRTITSNVSIRNISPTATPLPKTYGCVAVYIAGRHTNLVVYWLAAKPQTKKGRGQNGGTYVYLPSPGSRHDMKSMFSCKYWSMLPAIF